MTQEKVTINEARESINHLIQGVDPYTGQVLDGDGVFENPRIIACFNLMSDILGKIIERQESRQEVQRDPFRITQVQAQAIRFPEGDIGVKGVVSAINRVINTEVMTGLTILALYNKLKKKGILEKSSKNSVTKTITTSQSGKVGIITIKNTFQGQEYDRIMYTDQAKEYLREQLPIWFP